MTNPAPRTAVSRHQAPPADHLRRAAGQASGRGDHLGRPARLHAGAVGVGAALQVLVAAAYFIGRHAQIDSFGRPSGLRFLAGPARQGSRPSARGHHRPGSCLWSLGCRQYEPAGGSYAYARRSAHKPKGMCRLCGPGSDGVRRRGRRTSGPHRLGVLGCGIPPRWKSSLDIARLLETLDGASS